MFRRFTQKAKNAVIYAQEEARQMNHAAIGTEHILMGLLKEGEGIGAKALIQMGLDLNKVREEVTKVIGYNTTVAEPSAGDLPITPRTKKIFNLSFDEARLQGVNYVGTEHLLLALLREEEGVAGQVLISMGLRLDEVREHVMDLLGGGEGNNNNNMNFNDIPNNPGASPTAKRKNKSKTPTLDNFSRDLTIDATEGKLDPVIGREKEIERVIQVLSRRTKNNPVLIGDPGVGKTAIVEGLAQRIIENQVPEILSRKRVVALDLSSMIAGTKYRGEFEERLTKIINEIRASRDVIIFIDELHTIVGAGAAEGAIDAANILKPSLARGEFQCVGATTLDEYRKHIERDAALERRFQPIVVDEPTIEESIAILKGLRDRYEAHHGVKISDEATEEAVRLSNRYITDRFLPDKAIDLIDEASSKVRLANYILPPELKEKEARLKDLIKEKEEAIMAQEYESAAAMRDEEQHLKDEIENDRKEWINERSLKIGIVGPEEIAAIVSSWTGVPVSQLTTEESQRLINLENILHKRVIGQDEAIKAVSTAIRRARSGLKNPKRPVGSFIFLGPTGVGKTELARALAEAMFGNEDSIIRLDMSEYMEKHAVSRMIGSPPGYVGYEEGGQLTEKVRRRPYSVILLDEIEKAHPDVFNILLQVLEDGRLTDGQGRTVDFRNTVLIMTSNVGAESIRNSKKVGFTNVQDADSSYQEMKEQVMEKLKLTFRPEFINRVDEMIVFQSLNEEELKQVISLLMEELKQRIVENGFALEVSDKAVDFIMSKGYDPKFGARPLKRAIQKWIEDAIAEEILKANIPSGAKILVDSEGEEIKLYYNEPVPVNS
ncbi:MAG: ATP-dependent Clp protease ATP-binding subunit [Syntrophomonadaceae bacterium]|jgi:ATP-dependent Clp protease ATP-binding subunit ClpC|nr:ATP-dependent Clp protease ATP-binding subunit [Syntrophomonadaceae bacterium]